MKGGSIINLETMIILTIDIDRIERIQTCFYSFIYFCEHKYGVFIVKLISIF